MKLVDDDDWYAFYTCVNSNEYSTVYLLNGVMMSQPCHTARHKIVTVARSSAVQNEHDYCYLECIQWNQLFVTFAKSVPVFIFSSSLAINLLLVGLFWQKCFSIPTGFWWEFFFRTLHLLILRSKVLWRAVENLWRHQAIKLVYCKVIIAVDIGTRSLTITQIAPKS